MSVSSDMIDFMIRARMQDFVKFPSTTKCKAIFGNFESYHNLTDKASRAKADNLAKRLDSDASISFMLACKQVESLTEAEVDIYLKYLSRRLSHALTQKDDRKLLRARMLYGTILRKLPTTLTPEQEEVKLALQEQLEQTYIHFEK